MIADVLGRTMEFETRPNLFSPNHADRGTLAMLSCAQLQPGEKVLDLGCGWGLVGIYAAGIVGAQRVVMLDSDPAAIECARANARIHGAHGIEFVLSDGLAQCGEKDFDWILSNPPYNADFSVPKKFIEKGFNRLALGGRMLMVTRRLNWYKNKMTALFGGVKIHTIDGYYVFEAQRRSLSYASKPQRTEED